jgi:hypothetical protein
MKKCVCTLKLDCPIDCKCEYRCRPPPCRGGICQDKAAIQNQIDQVVRIPSSLFLLRLTSACSPTYVRPVNEGVKYDSYDRVLQRRRSLCKK